MSKLFQPLTLGLEAKVKRFFFNTDYVKSILSVETRKKLRKIGSGIRLTAQRSMRRVSKRAKRIAGNDYPPSQAGSPPNAHAESGAFASLKNILFAMNPDNMGVVVGPRKTNQHSEAGGFMTKGTIPSLHEFGGTGKIREKLAGNVWVPIGRRRPRPGQPARTRTVRYPKRPFMQPALEKYMPRIPQEFKGIVSTA